MRIFEGWGVKIWFVIFVVFLGVVANSPMVLAENVEVPEKCLVKNADNKSYKDNTDRCKAWRFYGTLSAAACEGWGNKINLTADIKAVQAIVTKCNDLIGKKTTDDPSSSGNTYSLQECQSTSALSKTPECQAIIAAAAKQANDDAKAKQENIVKNKSIRQCMIDKLDQYIKDKGLNTANKSSYLSDIRKITPEDGSAVGFGDAHMHIAQLYKDCGGPISDEVLNKYNEQTQEDLENQSETQCAIDQVGWIVCPATNFLTSAIVETYKFIANNFLSIKSNELFSETEESGQSVKKAWDGFRDVANIVFAILFVIVVLSQVTNIGISNYGIKKLLPRLLIFAILINISYWVSVIFVDLSNIIGKWIFNFLSEGGSDAHISNLGETIHTILAGGAAAASVGMAGGIFLSVVAALVAILLMVAILTIRQAAVVILIMLSPLAFAAAILPGTESLFSKWKNTLKSMLIIFPVCSLIMGGMLKASEILVKTAGGNPILEALYTLLPLIGLGSVFVAIKGALAAIDKLTGGSITGKLSSMASGLNKAAEKSPIGSLDKGINSRIAAKYQQFGGGKLSRRANRFAKAGEESRARALRDAQISDYENKATLNDGEQLHLSKLRADKQKEADLLTSSRARALSESIGSDSAAYLNQGLAAIGKQDGGQEFGVVLESLMSNQRISGKAKVEQMTNIIKSLTPEQAQSESVRKVMSAFVSKHGGELKKNDPALLKAIGDLADGSEQSGKSIYEGHAASADTYADASLAERAAWAPQTLQNIANNKSSWTPSQQHDAELKSAAILNDERILKDMSTSQGDLHRKIAGDTEFKVNHSASGPNSNSDPGPTKEQLIEQRRQESERWRRRGRGL